MERAQGGGAPDLARRALLGLAGSLAATGALAGATPSSPGAAPSSPGAAPSSLGAASSSPGAAPSSPGARDLVVHPFSADSPWNLPIPAGARLAGPGDPRVQALRSVPRPERLRVHATGWTIWVYLARSSDPVVTVSVSVRHLDSHRRAPEPRAGEVRLHVPPGAHPDPAHYFGVSRDPWADDPDGKDAHMVVIDPDRRFAHEFWHLERDRFTGTRKAVAYARVPLDGAGVFIAGEAVARRGGHYYDPAVRTLGWGATRAYGGSCLGGLIRRGEILAGPPNHALAIALPTSLLGHPPAGGLPAYPASKDDGPDAGYRGSIVMGTRLAIDRRVDLAQLGLAPPVRQLAVALQTHGAFVVDKAGGIGLYADGVAARDDGAALNAHAADLARVQSLLDIIDA